MIANLRGNKLSDHRQKSFWTIALAVLSIYAVDFAINVGKAEPNTSLEPC
jgi:hypothetical protein